MTDVVGLPLCEAEKKLNDSGIKFSITETFSPKPLSDTDRIMVLRQRQKDDICEIVVGHFKTEL